MTDERLDRARRIRRGSEFRAIRETGASRAHPLLIIRYARNGLPHSRFGFVVGRRVAARAVQRNRIRRQLREIARRTAISAGWDVIFIARQQAAHVNFRELQRAVLDLERRAGLRTEPHQEQAPSRAEA